MDRIQWLRRFLRRLLRIRTPWLGGPLVTAAELQEPSDGVPEPLLTAETAPSLRRRLGASVPRQRKTVRIDLNCPEQVHLRADSGRLDPEDRTRRLK